MRLKKIANAYSRLNEDVKYFVKNPETMKGLWHEVFANSNPLHIEIGCGKGRFIINMCKTYPNINFVAIEKFDSVLIRTLENALENEVSNLRLVLFDAIKLEKVFAPNEINTIYLNFSDPWPKTKHARKRLTNQSFLKIFDNLLDNYGKIVQKTDNRLLFESSLESFSKDNWYLSNISLDLHKTPRFNIQTEYEEKWSKKGPIYTLEAYKNKNLGSLYSFEFSKLNESLPFDVSETSKSRKSKEEVEQFFSQVKASDNTKKDISIDLLMKFDYYELSKRNNENGTMYFSLLSKEDIIKRTSSMCAIFTCRFKDTNDVIAHIINNDYSDQRYRFKTNTLVITYETVLEVFTSKIYIEIEVK